MFFLSVYYHRQHSVSILFVFQNSKINGLNYFLDNPVFQPSTITNPPTIRFATPSNQQSTRFNQNNNEHHMTNSRGNSRGRIYRRGLHNNNNYRRDYYQNRNNNRNIFS